MNNVVTYEQMLDQPMPDQFTEEDVSGGCQAGGAILVLVIIIVGVVAALSKIK